MAGSAVHGETHLQAGAAPGSVFLSVLTTISPAFPNLELALRGIHVLC